MHLIFSKGCFREGYDYLTSEYTLKINVETASKCQALCQEDSRCWRFTHLGGLNATECYLIYDNEATVSTLLDGAVSGPKYCQRKPRTIYYLIFGQQYLIFVIMI